ncbi:protein of unknown function [Bacillus velezensis]|nr:protein of unknown function [Bacillus velezensis]
MNQLVVLSCLPKSDINKGNAVCVLVKEYKVKIANAANEKVEATAIRKLCVSLLIKLMIYLLENLSSFIP